MKRTALRLIPVILFLGACVAVEAADVLPVTEIVTPLILSD